MPLALLLGGFVALVALRAVLTHALLMRRATLSLGLVRQLRMTAQAALIAADWRWLSGQRSADHAAVIVTQAEQVGREANRAVDLASSLVTLLGLLVAAMWLAWPLTLATLGFGAVAAGVWFTLRRRTDALGVPFATAYQALQGHVVDGLTHLRAARIAGAEDTLARDFVATARSIEEIELRYIATGHRAHLGLQVISAALLAILVWFGLRALSLPLAVFVPVLAIFARIVPLIGNMQQGWRAWRFCRPALDNLRGTVAEARAAAEPAIGNSSPITFDRDLTFENVGVTFAGRKQPVLEDFRCQIAAGTVVGVSGPSGSGKSTFADLLSGLVAPDCGTIRVDGLSLQGECRIRWRRQVAYVEQVPYLFNGTISANLSWGAADPDLDAMERALRDASAAFVFDLPQGLETIVGEVGRQFSGGERQRISLARALLRKPSLIILDEVTAALDASNETAIARTIERLRGTCTFVILGHRPALHGLADQIIELRHRV
ncbi:ABC transporter ATP-binding protein [Altererythrobacter sp. TH136]|nr:ABC transporter ATP-binding protein [Altererythrobacter sp. TH136]